VPPQGGKQRPGLNLGCALGRRETLQVTRGEFDSLAVHQLNVNAKRFEQRASQARPSEFKPRHVRHEGIRCWLTEHPAREHRPANDPYREQPAKQTAFQAVVTGSTPVRYSRYAPLMKLANIPRSDRGSSGFDSQVAHQSVLG
jgi:hypothetical protein